MSEPQYVTLDDLRGALEIDSTDDRLASELTAVIESASSSVNEFCNRVFVPSGTVEDPVTREYDTAGGLLVIDDLITLSTIEYESGATWGAIDAGTVVLLPRNAAVEVPAEPYTMLKTKTGTPFPAVVRITGVWGWAEVPAKVQQATLLQCLRLHKSKAIPTGVVGGADTMGVMRLSGDLHPDAQTLLGRLRRIPIG